MCFMGLRFKKVSCALFIRYETSKPMISEPNIRKTTVSFTVFLIPRFSSIVIVTETKSGTSKFQITISTMEKGQI